MIRVLVLSLLVAVAAGVSGKAEAQDDFYRGKTIKLLIGAAPGGGYDQDARLVAGHLSRHLAGNPTIVPQNMPGASSLVLTNHLYNTAPRDGTVIGIINQAMPLEQFLKSPNTNYDVTQFAWLGRTRAATQMAVVWHTVPVNSINDVYTRETVMGGSGPTSLTDIIPVLLNNLAGTRFRLVSGYSGVTELGLAMERGEIEGGATPIDALLGYRSDWLRDKKVKMLVLYTRERHPAMPDVPTMVELGKTEEARAILSLYAGSADIGRSFLTTQGVPPQRVAQLRAAFDAMFKDPLLLEDARMQRIDLGVLSGEKVQEIVMRMSQFPPDLIEKAKAARGKAK
jgi:tripartite-type tricarboxylate transporter receptor subunit TctC